MWRRRCSSGGPLHAVHAAVRHVAEPDRRLADVPVLVRGGDAEQLAPGAPRQPRGRRRVAGVHRGDRGRARTGGSRPGTRESGTTPRPSHWRGSPAWSRQGGASRACSSPTPVARRAPTLPWKRRRPARDRRRRLAARWPRARSRSREGSPRRRPSTPPGIREVVDGLRDAARARCAAGFRVVEIHAAHGYLLHEFLSPLTNHAHRRVRRQLREPDAAAARGRGRGPHRLAGRLPLFGADLGDRLGRGRLGHRPASSSRPCSRRAAST